MPCDLARITEIGRRRGLPVIEDAACAIGSEIQGPQGWERIGKPHGDVACFSFHPRKLLTTGDGGMITTFRADWDAQLRLWRQHGMSTPDTVRYRARQVINESYLALGFNYRLTDLQAAVGRVQLARLPGLLERRRRLAQRYHALLAAVPGLRIPAEPEWARTNWQSYCVGLPDGCEQRAVMQALLDAGIATRRGIMCAHREPAYPRDAWSCGTPPGACECAKGTCARLAESERAQDQAILLPLFDGMTEGDQDAVVEHLAHVCAVTRG
jgi:dTDP-4-amino-4,6-dideoxygalactose transaminase